MTGTAGRHPFARLTILFRSLSETSQPTTVPLCTPYAPLISSTPMSIVPPPPFANATRSSGLTASASRLKSTCRPSDPESNRFVGISGNSGCLLTDFFVVGFLANNIAFLEF